MCNADVSHSTFSLCKGIDTINSFSLLALKLPRLLEELGRAAHEFSSLSRDRLFN
jgi:hypothetical protein